MTEQDSEVFLSLTAKLSTRKFIKKYVLIKMIPKWIIIISICLRVLMVQWSPFYENVVPEGSVSGPVLFLFYHIDIIMEHHKGHL